MIDQPTDALERPDEIRDDHDERMDGRPTGPDQVGLRPGTDHAAAPTIAPEEEGATTQHRARARE